MIKEAGFTIVENLVAIVLVGIALTGSTALFATTFQSSASAREYTAIAAEAQSIFDEYLGNYQAMLDEFDTPYAEIQNGQSVSKTTNSQVAKGSFAITLTAIKTKSLTPPEAVRVRIVASQRRGKLGETNFRFETIIPQGQG